MSNSFETESSEAVVWMMRITDKEYRIDDRNEFQPTLPKFYTYELDIKPHNY